jgi:hypothetical protein
MKFLLFALGKESRGFCLFFSLSICSVSHVTYKTFLNDLTASIGRRYEVKRFVVSFAKSFFRGSMTVLLCSCYIFGPSSFFYIFSLTFVLFFRLSVSCWNEEQFFGVDVYWCASVHGSMMYVCSEI